MVFIAIKIIYGAVRVLLCPVYLTLYFGINYWIFNRIEYTHRPCRNRYQPITSRGNIHELPIARWTFLAKIKEEFRIRYKGWILRAAHGCGVLVKWAASSSLSLTYIVNRLNYWATDYFDIQRTKRTKCKYCIMKQ